jgi:hypothetical protein
MPPVLGFRVYYPHHSSQYVLVTEKVGKYPSRIFYTKKGNDFDAPFLENHEVL